MRASHSITVQEAEAKLAKRCMRGECSTGELDDKMRVWGLSADDRQAVIDRLVELKFVDDERFCRAFVNDKVKYNRWGRRKIEQALWQKHVPSEVSSPILDAVPDADYIEALSSLLNAKWRTIKANTDYERSMKFIKYALGRGFDMDIIRQCINEMTNEAVLEDES